MTYVIHPRMPLVLKRDQIVPWLEQPAAATAVLEMIPPMLERTGAEAQLRLW